MTEKQKKAFALLLFAYLIFIVSLLLNFYWSNSTELTGPMSASKDISLRILYLLFAAIAISSFVTLVKENRKAKEPLGKLLVPTLLITLPVLILLGQISYLIILLTS